ncbi:unnamed protein product [Linum tenue]|nr:unnamed protein product [Linum tenue]CAI0626493.1 unnamed protein product [Linum tenue]
MLCYFFLFCGCTL